MLILKIALLAGVILTAALLVSQIANWRRSPLPKRQRIIRLSSGVTLILLLALTLLGNVFGIVFTLDKDSLVKRPDLAITTLRYGSLVAGLACLLLVLALLDIHEVINTHRQARIEARARLRGKDGRDP